MTVRYELNEYNASDGALLRTTHFLPVGPVDIEVDSDEHEIADFYGTVKRVSTVHTLRITALISSIKRDSYRCTCADDPSQLCTMHRRSIL